MTTRDILVTRNYSRLLAELRTRFGAVAVREWDALPAHDEANLAQFIDRMAVATDAARTRAARLAGGYLYHFAPTAATPTLTDLRPFDPAEQWRVPFIQAWSSLKQGLPLRAAVAMGHARAAQVAGAIVTASARAASAFIDSNEPRIIGWNRVPDGACCDWCASAATEDYRSAESASLDDQHANCNCDVTPITADAAPGREINAPLIDAPPVPADDATGYVTPDGDAAPRPEGTNP